MDILRSFWVCLFLPRVQTNYKGSFGEQAGKDHLLLLKWVEV